MKDEPRVRPKRRTLTVRSDVHTVLPEQYDNLDTKRVKFHADVLKIADDAFRGWKYLKDIVFEGTSLQSIGTNAFRETAIRRFVAPRSLRYLGTGAFYGCKSLKQVELNEGLTSIGATGRDVASYGVF